MRKIIFHIIGFFILGTALSTDLKPKTKWMYIALPGYHIIFPSTAFNDAQLIGNFINNYDHLIKRSTLKNLHKFEIILQPYKSFFNGFVSASPIRSEFFTYDDSDLFTEDRAIILTIHELRHKHQYFLNVGKHNLPIDSYRWSLNFFANPRWAIEGDAVLSETLLSNGGRGVNPSWFAFHRSAIAEKKRYSLLKYVHGSYNTFIPSFYVHGYLLIKYIAEQYGFQTIENGLSKNKLSFLSGLKKSTGKPFSILYKDFVESYNQSINSTLITKKTEGQRWYLNNNNQNFHARSVYQLDPYSYIYVHQSQEKIPQIIKVNIKKGKRQVLKNISIRATQYIKLNKNFAIWTQRYTHVRYTDRNFNHIFIYDIKGDITSVINLKERIKDPDIDLEGKKIIAVHTNNSNISSLILMNRSGKITKKISLAPYQFFNAPAFNSDGSKVIAYIQSTKGRSLVLLDINTGEKKLLIKDRNWLIDNPRFIAENQIVFQANIDGLVNLYLYNLSTAKIYKLTDTAYRASYPSNIINNEILYSNFSLKGDKIYKINLKNKIEININKSAKDLYNKQIDAELNRLKTAPTPNINNIKTKTYQALPYPYLKKLFNFRSLIFFSKQTESLNDIPLSNLLYNDYLGMAFIANDPLNKFVNIIGYRTYNLKFNNFFFSTQLNHFYPILSASISYGDDASFFSLNQRILQFKTTDFNLNVTLPFYFQKSLWTSSIILRYRLNAKHFSNVQESFLKAFPKTANFLEKFPEKVDYFPHNISLSITQQKERAIKDLMPRLGYFLNFRMLRDLKQQNNWIVNFIAYLPSLFTNHGMSIRYSKQHFNESLVVRQRIATVYPQSLLLRELLSFKYSLAVAYPDFNISHWLYIKRMYLNFYVNLYNFNASSNDFFNSFQIVPYRDFTAELNTNIFLKFLASPLKWTLYGYWSESQHFNQSLTLGTRFTLGL